MIISTIIPDYENRNAGLTYTLVENPIKYFYPVRYGYNKTALLYSLSFPYYKKPVASSLGLEDLLGQAGCHRRQNKDDPQGNRSAQDTQRRQSLQNLPGPVHLQDPCPSAWKHLHGQEMGGPGKKDDRSGAGKKTGNNRLFPGHPVFEERTERIHHREPGRDPKAGYLHEQTGGNTMNTVTQDDIGKLQKDPLSFAVLMDEQQIEHVIVTFVAVLIRRNENGGGQN